MGSLHDVTDIPTIILPAVVYVCETCVFHIEGRTYRLRVFKNRMLKKVFGCKMDKVTG